MLKKYFYILTIGSLSTYLITKGASLLVSSGFSFLRIGTADGWIQFFATILGAIITILTVLDVLRRDELSEIETLAKSNMPYLDLKPIYNFKDPNYISRTIVYPEYGDGFIPIWFEFKNLTSNAAKSFNIKDQFFYIYSNDLEQYELYDNDKLPIRFQGFTPVTQYDVFVQPNDTNFNRFNFNFFIWEQIYLEETNKFRIEFIYTYKDIIDLAKYEHTYTFEFTANSTASNEFHINVESEDSSIVRTIL